MALPPARPNGAIPDAARVAAFAAARERVLATIADACGRVGRDPADVALVAVSKTVTAERLVAAVAAGLTILGENRVQEAEAKAAVVTGATWHLVGPLQSNKARRALSTFAVIESVDSVGLAERLDRLAGEERSGEERPREERHGEERPREERPREERPREERPRERVPVLLQVNVDRDPAKAGFMSDALVPALGLLAAFRHLEIRGLMTVGRLVDRAEEARSTFAALRSLSERLRSGPGRGIVGPELSMGMSDDYAVAVEEGATIVRVGRALFGERS